MNTQDINLNSSIKKLLAEKFPSVKAKNPATNALAICAVNFIELLVQATATICNDKQKNLITQNDVLEALDQLGLHSIYEKAKEANQEISSSIKKKRESWKALKTPENNLTEEEASRIQEELYNEAIRCNEERKKKKETPNTKNDP